VRLVPTGTGCRLNDNVAVLNCNAGNAGTIGCFPGATEATKAVLMVGQQN
jgi:hypothetical protein